jgi:hypothetical protein
MRAGSYLLAVRAALHLLRVDEEQDVLQMGLSRECQGSVKVERYR